MKRRIILLIAFVLVFSVSTESLFAQSVADLRKKQEENKVEAEKTKQKLNEAKEQKSEVEEEVEVMDVELNRATDVLEETSAKLDETTELLQITQEELSIAEKNHEQQFEVLKKRVRFMYEHGKAGYLEIALQAKSFSDFLNRVDNINRIVKYDQGLVGQLEEIEATISNKLDETETQKNQIEKLVLEQTEQKKNMEAALEKKRLLIVSLQADEQKFAQQITDLEKSDKEIENLIKAAERAAVQRARAASGGGSMAGSVQTTPYTGGKLGWPVPGRSNISSGYVNRTYPRREFHTGLDIPAPTGTSIVAAESGTVIFSGTRGGYGRTVIIDHGNGLSTLYGHNSSLVVSVGRSVRRGDIIAKAGSTGFSTGPHCHFEVRINGAHTNPWNYLR